MLVSDRVADGKSDVDLLEVVVVDVELVYLGEIKDATRRGATGLRASERESASDEGL